MRMSKVSMSVRDLGRGMGLVVAVVGVWGAGGVWGQRLEPPPDPGPDEVSEEERSRVPTVPEHLLDDEHVMEEYGVNHFTTPSIKRIFEDLAAMGKLPYGELKREVPSKVPRDRLALALAIGGLIADGFLVVQSERIEDVEAIGRGLLKRAKVLGAGMRVQQHAQSILESSLLGDWEVLKRELAATQADVQAEMVLLRDVEVAHMIALGGWLRAFEIATAAALSPYSEEKAKRLARVEVASYFLFSLEGLHPDLQETPLVVGLREKLEVLRDRIDVPEGKVFSEAEVKELAALARELVAHAESAAR